MDWNQEDLHACVTGLQPDVHSICGLQHEKKDVLPQSVSSIFFPRFCGPNLFSSREIDSRKKK